MTRGYDPYIIEDDIACWFVASGLYRAEEDGELWLVQFAGDGRYRFWQYADLFMPAAPELCDDLEELAGECQVLAQDCEQVAHRLERHDWGTADLLYEQAGEWHLSAQQYLNHAYLPGA